MLLFDIGNTAIKVALSSKEAILRVIHIRTCARPQLLDALASALRQLTLSDSLAVVSSVVAALTPVVIHACSAMNLQVCVIPKDIAIPLTNTYTDPQTLGIDRLLACYAARKLYPDEEALMVVDFGTAITIDCVYKNRFLGGAILPSEKTALYGLSQKTSLPGEIPPCERGRLTFGTSTVECLQNGISFGYTFMLQAMLHEMANLLPHPKIIATGGNLNSFLMKESLFHHIVPNLVLEGERLLACDCIKN